MRETTTQAMRRGKNQTKVAKAMAMVAELRAENATLRREDLQVRIDELEKRNAYLAEKISREIYDHALTKAKLEDLRSELRAALEKKS